MFRSNIEAADTMMKQLAGGVLRGEPAHWLLEPNRHGERVTSQHGCVCVCVWERARGAVRSVCVSPSVRMETWSKRCKKWRKNKKVGRESLGSGITHAKHFFFSLNLLRVVLYRRASRSVCVLEVGRSERKKKKKTSGMADSRAPRAGGPGITRHWRGWYCACALASPACTLGSVDAGTLAWLSASICQFVFMFEGFAGRTATTTTRNSWSFTGKRLGISPREATRQSADVERWGVRETSNFSNSASGGEGGLALSAVCEEERAVVQQLNVSAWILFLGGEPVTRTTLWSLRGKHTGDGPFDALCGPINTFYMRLQHQCCWCECVISKLTRGGQDDEKTGCFFQPVLCLRPRNWLNSCCGGEKWSSRSVRGDCFISSIL